MTRALPYLLLVVEVVLFFRHILLLDGYAIAWDIRYFHLPHAHLYAEALTRGELPLWDPYTYCGRPFQANIQTQVFYPTVLLAAALGNAIGREHLLFLLELNTILHVLLAGVFAYWLGLALGFTRPAALLAATAFQLGGFFASQLQHMGAVNVAAWMPLTWWAVVRLREGFRWTPFAALTVALAMSVLAGLTPLTTVVFASAFGLAALFALFRQARWSLCAWVVAASAWAAVLTAVQLLPTIELTGESIAQFRTDWLKGGGGLPLQSLVSLVLPNHYGLFDLRTYRAPFEITFMYLHCGWVALALGLPGARRAPLWALLTALSGLAMLGDSTPIGRAVLAILPTIVKIGLHPEFTMPAFTLALAVLAGWGAMRLPPRWAWTAAFLAALNLIAVSSGRPFNTVSLAAEPGITPARFEGDPEAVSRLRLLMGDSAAGPRLDTLGDSMQWHMAAPLLQLPSANGNDPMALARVIQVRLAFCDGERWGAYYEVSHPHSPALDAAGVRYLLSRQPAAGLPIVAEAPGRVVQENPDALPRYWLVGQTRSVSTMAEAAALLRAPGFDPRRWAIVETGPPLEGSARGQVRVKEYSLHRVLLEMEADGEAHLASSDAHYPGWRAWLDGREVPIAYTNVAFRGLRVPPGRHTVEFRFTSPMLAWGSALSLAGWLLLAAAVGRGFARREGIRPTNQGFANTLREKPPSPQKSPEGSPAERRLAPPESP